MKKIWKRTLALMLAAAVTCPAAVLTTAAATPTDSKYITFDAYSADKSFVENNRGAIDALAEGMLKRQGTVDVSKYKVSPQYISALYSAALATHPDVFFVDRYSSFSCASYYQGNNVYIQSVSVPYISVSDDEAASMLQEFYDEADHYLELVSDELSACRDEFSKAVVLHDEIVLDAHYVLENSDYNFLVKKYGLCENYSRVYAYLLSQVGIYSEIVDSDSMGHEWMMVRLDGNYYHADVTWDDPTPDSPGFARHQFFLYSDEGIANADANNPHEGFTTINTASDHFDNALFHAYNYKMCKLDADKTEFYTVANTKTSKGYGTIVKYDYTTNEETTVRAINDYWRVVGNENSFWQGAFSGLDTICGRLVYNTHDSICLFDPSDNTVRTLSTIPSGSDKYYYGVRIRDNKLYGILSESPNESGTETYIMDIAAKVTFDSDGGSNVAQQTVITGEAAVAPEAPSKAGYSFKGWTLDGEDYDFSSAVNGDITLKAKWEKIDSALITGSSLSLEGEIGINFYVELGSGAEDSGYYVKMTGPEGETTVPVTAECLALSGDIYKFTYRVTAKQGEKDVTISIYDPEGNALTLYKPDGQTSYDGNVYTYSVRDYIDQVKTAPADSYTGEVVDLVKAIEDYTTASAVLFGDDTVEASSNNNLNTVTKESVEAYRLESQGEAPAEIEMTGYSLVLDSETRIKLYMATDNKDNCVAAIDDEAAELKESGSYYYVSVDNISAKDLDETHTLSINNGAYTLKFNALSYVYTVLSAYENKPAKAKLCNTVRALKLYHDAADAYFRSKNS